MASLVTTLRRRLQQYKATASTDPSSTPEEAAARKRARRRRLFLSKVARVLPALQLLLALAGYLQFLAVPLLAKKSYIDENAFQPGQVNTYFGWADVSAADRYADGLQRFVDSDDSLSRSQFIVHALQDQGLSAEMQQLHMRDESGPSKYNAYARVRAPKTSGSEVLVICAAWESRQTGMKNVRGTATLLALARHLQKLSMWSKDIFLVFTDGEIDGLQKWLAAYFGDAGSVAEPLSLGGGAIWGAMALDYPYHSFSHIGLYYDGVNGRLPNLDIVHGAAYISKWIGGVPVRLHNSTVIEHQQTPDFSDRLHQYKERSLGILQQLSYGAQTLPSGPEGLFAQFGVDSIGFFAVPAEGPHGFYTIGRVIESMLRAFNNLTERLHASFFLYLLPEPFHFLPVATYLSAPVLLAASLTLAGLRLWHAQTASPGRSVYLVTAASYILGGLLCRLDGYLPPQLFALIVPVIGSLSWLFMGAAAEHSAFVTAFNCLLTGMVVSVLTILNFGLGAAVAGLNGTSSLLRLYTSGPSKRSRTYALRQLVMAAILAVVLTQYGKAGLQSHGTQAIAPYIIYLGVIPLWLQLMWS